MIAPSILSEPLDPAVEQQLTEIREEREYLNGQLNLVEADLERLKQIKDSTSPAKGGTRLPANEWQELKTQLSEDVASINAIKARLSVLQAEEARLDPSVDVPAPTPAPAPSSYGQNTSLEVLFMEEAKDVLSPELFESLLAAAKERRQSLGVNEPSTSRERSPRHTNHRHGRGNDRRHGYQSRGRSRHR